MKKKLTELFQGITEGAAEIVSGIGTGMVSTWRNMNLPNKLTLIRIALIPVFMIALYAEKGPAHYVSLVIFLLACLTDFLDGYIARKQNLITDFGKFADPLADKMLVTAGMLWFTGAGRLPAWVVLIVICREFAVSGLRMTAAEKGRVIAAGWSGKVKTAATMVCIALMLLPVVHGVDVFCAWVITLTTLYSGIEYFVKNGDVINSI